MTARDFLAAALRRWYVVVLGAALTVGVFAVVQRQAPVFFTQYNIVVVGPSGTEHDNNVLENPRYGLQPLVGVVSTDLNDGHPPLLTGDVDATMVGMGARDGVQVRVPNLGTQWRPALLGQLPRRAGGGRRRPTRCTRWPRRPRPGWRRCSSSGRTSSGCRPTCAPTPSRPRRTPSSTPCRQQVSRARRHRADRHRAHRCPGLLAGALAPAPPPRRRGGRCACETAAGASAYPVRGGDGMSTPRNTPVRPVTIAVVTWNSADVLPGLVESLPDGAGDVPYRLVVVDNDSIGRHRRGGPAPVPGRHRGADRTQRGLRGRGQRRRRRHPRRAGGAGAQPGRTPASRAACPRWWRRSTARAPGSRCPGSSTATAALIHSMRRRPTLLRAFADAFVGATLAGRWPLTGEVVSDPARYAERRDAGLGRGVHAAGQPRLPGRLRALGRVLLPLLRGDRVPPAGREHTASACATSPTPAPSTSRATPAPRHGCGRSSPPTGCGSSRGWRPGRGRRSTGWRWSCASRAGRRGATRSPVPPCACSSAPSCCAPLAGPRGSTSLPQIRYSAPERSAPRPRVRSVVRGTTSGLFVARSRSPGGGSGHGTRGL